MPNLIGRKVIGTARYCNEKHEIRIMLLIGRFEVKVRQLVHAFEER